MAPYSYTPRKWNFREPPSNMPIVIVYHDFSLETSHARGDQLKFCPHVHEYSRAGQTDDDDKITGIKRPSYTFKLMPSERYAKGIKRPEGQSKQASKFNEPVEVHLCSGCAHGVRASKPNFGHVVTFLLEKGLVKQGDKCWWKALSAGQKNGVSTVGFIRTRPLRAQKSSRKSTKEPDHRHEPTIEEEESDQALLTNDATSIKHQKAADDEFLAESSTGRANVYLEPDYIKRIFRTAQRAKGIEDKARSEATAEASSGTSQPRRDIRSGIGQQSVSAPTPKKRDRLVRAIFGGER